MIGADADGRPDGVGTHLNQQRVQLDDLLARHSLHLTCVGDAAEQHAAVRIGERRDLIRQIFAARSPRSASGKLDLLELPAAVFPQLQLERDSFVAVTHRRPPTLKTLRLSAVTALAAPADKPRQLPLERFVILCLSLSSSCRESPLTGWRSCRRPGIMGVGTGQCTPHNCQGALTDRRWQGCA